MARLSNCISVIMPINRYTKIHVDVLRKIYNYIEEIIIVSSMPPLIYNIYKKLIKALDHRNKITIINENCIIPECISKGVSSATCEWILYLEDDEIPSKALIDNLRELIKIRYVNAYRLYRYDLYIYLGYQKLIKLFKKNVFIGSNIYHHLYLIQSKYKDLEYRYFIIHYYRSDLTSYLRKIIKYSKIDANTLGDKLKLILRATKDLFSYDGMNLYELKMSLIYKIKSISSIVGIRSTIYLIYIAFPIISFIFNIRKSLKENSHLDLKNKIKVVYLGSIYSLITTFNIIITLTKK